MPLSVHGRTAIGLISLSMVGVLSFPLVPVAASSSRRVSEGFALSSRAAFPYPERRRDIISSPAASSVGHPFNTTARQQRRYRPPQSRDQRFAIPPARPFEFTKRRL